MAFTVEMQRRILLFKAPYIFPLREEVLFCKDRQYIPLTVQVKEKVTSIYEMKVNKSTHVFSLTVQVNFRKVNAT